MKYIYFLLIITISMQVSILSKNFDKQTIKSMSKKELLERAFEIKKQCKKTSSHFALCDLYE